MRISDWSSDVCSSDRPAGGGLTLRQALRRPEFFALALSFTFTGFSMYMVIVQVVPFLVERGYAPLKAATAFGLSGMLSVGGVISTGWLSHRYGLRPIALLSFACTFVGRSEEHTSEIQSLMRISYAVFCLQKKTHKNTY